MITAENAVLSCILQDNDKAHIAASRGIRAEHFGSIPHSIMYRTAMKMIEDRMAADHASLKSKLEYGGQWDSVVVEWASLEYDLPDPNNFDTYCEQLLNGAVKRRLDQVAGKMDRLSKSSATNEDILVEINRYVDEVDRMLNSSGGRKRECSIGESVKDFVESLKLDDPIEIPTGFDELDDHIQGLAPGGLYVIAGRPGMGKTALALNIARNIARRGLSVGLISLEMSREELALRLLSDVSEIPAEKIKRRILEDMDWEVIDQAKEEICGWRLFINDAGEANLEVLAARMKSMVLREKLDVIFVDYLQLLESSGNAARWEVVSQISRSMKMLAKDLRIPVVALSQLSRAVESRVNKRPVLSDLRESGSIEQDANAVLMLFRSSYYGARRESGDPVIAECIIAKNRSGTCGTAQLMWHGRHTRFESPEPQVGYTAEDIPASAWRDDEGVDVPEVDMEAGKERQEPDDVSPDDGRDYG